MTSPQQGLDEQRVRALISESLREQLELPEDVPLEPDTAFTDLGLDSTGVQMVAEDLQQALGVQVAAETLFDYPTIRSLSAHLAAAPAQPASR